MRNAEFFAAVLFLLVVALAVWLGRPETADSSLFGEEMALEPVLPPLVVPGGTLELHGSVRQADGKPAVDAFLVLLRPDDDESEAEPVYRAYTDSEGRFTITDLAPGAYRVVLTHRSTPPETLAIELPVAGEVSWQLPGPLPPMPVLPRLRRTRVTGQVHFPEGRTTAGELAGYEVALVPFDDTPAHSAACERRASTDEAGRFALEEIIVASYRIEVLPPWSHGGSWPVLGRGTCTLLETEGNVAEVTLDVGAIEGELREEEGRPLVGALVRVSALDAHDPIGAPQSWPVVVTDVAGRFRIELLPPGRYRVHQRAGTAVRDVDVLVESGKVTSVPVGELDPRTGEDAGG